MHLTFSIPSRAKMNQDTIARSNLATILDVDQIERYRYLIVSNHVMQIDM